jgi:hypothetical protein
MPMKVGEIQDYLRPDGGLIDGRGGRSRNPVASAARRHFSKGIMVDSLARVA